MWAIDQVKAAVTQKDIPSIYLWYGEERYLIQEALNLLKGYFLVDDPSGSGIEKINPKEFTPLDIVERGNTISFFNQRLIIVEDIPYFQESQTELEPFFSYFANPNPQTHLLFIADKVHKGRKFFKEISNKGMVLEFSLPKRPQEWQEWVSQRLEDFGKSMKSTTIQYFIEWAGHQPGVLNQELEKLAIYSAERREITKEDINQITPPMIETTVFSLLDAVAVRDSAKALKRLDEVVQSEDPLKVLTMLTRHIRLLLGAISVNRKGGGRDECMKTLEIRSPYEAQKILSQSFKLSERILIWALKECLEANLALKSNTADKRLVLEMFVIKFCSMN